MFILSLTLTQVHRLAETSLRNEPFKELIPRLLPALCDADVLYLLYQLNPNTSRVEQVLLTMCKWPSLDVRFDRAIKLMNLLIHTRSLPPGRTALQRALCVLSPRLPPHRRRVRQTRGGHHSNLSRYSTDEAYGQQ